MRRYTALVLVLLTFTGASSAEEKREPPPPPPPFPSSQVKWQMVVIDRDGHQKVYGMWPRGGSVPGQLEGWKCRYGEASSGKGPTGEGPVEVRNVTCSFGEAGIVNMVFCPVPGPGGKRQAAGAHFGAELVNYRTRKSASVSVSCEVTQGVNGDDLGRTGSPTSSQGSP